MLASDSWVIAGTLVAVLVLLATVWLVVLARKAVPTPKQRAEDRAAADERSQAHAARLAEAALVGKTWRFEFRLRVAVGDTVPSEPPIQIIVNGANVWVHEVRLTWRPSEPMVAHWVIKDEPCLPWGDGSLPYQLNSGGNPLQLAWPGPNPRQQAQIMQKIKVTYSALRDGPRHEIEVVGGSVAWQ